jgi:hypothetical protein
VRGCWLVKLCVCHVGPPDCCDHPTLVSAIVRGTCGELG